MTDVTGDATAEVVTREWKRLLDLDDVGDDDDFFALGGDSLLAIEFVERVEAALGIAFPLESLFFDGSLGGVVKAIERARADGADPAPHSGTKE